MVCEEMRRKYHPGAWDHEAGGAGDAILQHAEDGFIHCMTRSDVIGVDYQKTSIGRIP
jgi:hypothetical protein